MTHFSSQFYINNRLNLKKSLNKDGLIILSANGLIQKNADETFKFYQDPNFYYLTGLIELDLVLVIDSPSEYIIRPKRSKSFEMFNGTLTIDDIKKISGIRTVYDETEGWTKLKHSLKENKMVYSLKALPPYISKYGFYSNPVRRRLITKLKYYNSKILIEDLSQNLAKLRSIKQLPEINAIKQAITITGKALAYINENKFSYINEKEVEADLNYYMNKLGGDIGFDAIVANAKNAATLHYSKNNDPLTTNTLTVIDCGADYLGYKSDITRTICLSGIPTKRQQEIYNAVKEVQAYAISLIKPGVILSDYENKVTDYLGDKLIKLGLIQQKSKLAIREYYPQLTSHFIGLSVHDSGIYNNPLKANAVITVEPGIYIKKEGIGVRIEDDILVTKDGNVNLSKHISKELR